MRTSLHNPVIWKVMKRTVWNGVASWLTKRLNNSAKYLLHAKDDHQFKEEEKGSAGELSKVCSQIVVKCLYLAYIGRPDIPCSVNNLARAFKKWTRACDKRLARLISYMHFTSEFQQCCHVGNTGQQCRVGVFQVSVFAGDLEDSKSTSGGTLCMLSSHTYVPGSWMCKKQTSVWHSSTESGCWSVTLFHQPSTEKPRASAERPAAYQTIKQTHQHPNQDSFSKRRSWVVQCWWCFLKREIFSCRVPFFDICEDNEAVIKMIIKGRSPTTRHVSRTHRVALDWLFDRINLVTKIQIKYVDTKNNSQTYWQKVTSHVTIRTIFFVCSTSVIFSSVRCPQTMSKRIQEGTREEWIVASQDRRWTLLRRL